MVVFSLTNSDQSKLSVQLEPWANIYYLKKGDELTIHEPDSLKGFYHINLWGSEKEPQIIGCGDFGYDYPEVYINGKPAKPWDDFLV